MISKLDLWSMKPIIIEYENFYNYAISLGPECLTPLCEVSKILL